ncbi:transcription initiation factor TFIID subunit 12 isoform X1 [Lingula anatina]|uniref:Transcription initiation factor TFIID subunit 12 n=1 Tax=Lingula anatina TaxID=7574 RepID=A0A1S3IQB9_LINAN|nr:transcription initiation factor TFIID subunit 12 isoform X1 [Lingula anatina]|eukprot:XP_013400412.1 transcription initiation factor TFIID subunit 12 isoform X1 [Lingula anatina]
MSTPGSGPTGASPSPVGGSTPIRQPGTLADTIRQVEQKIASYGPGPHSIKHQEEISKLNQLRAKAKEQMFAQKSQVSEGASASSLNSLGGASVPIRPAPQGPGGLMLGESRVLDKRRLQELVKEVDPLEQLDEEVEEVLMHIADDFIDNVVNAACLLAKHRKANTLDVKDVQLHLERNWNMWIPGFGSEEVRPFKKSVTTEAHKQRLALIKKTLKKY